MSSLQDQLRTLKIPVSKQLGVEKSTDSLLFDRKEAASFTSEEYFNLGLLGLQKLRKLDRTLADAEFDLFHPSKVSFNRATITADQNDELDKKLKSLLVHICPYFHHQSCRQVLEWLIFKYQVHLYNADLIANLFLLYHSTNSFGRLLSILNLNKNDWSFCSDFALKGLPIPFEFLVKACLRSGSSLISSLSASLTEAVQLVGENYVSEKMQMHFTFFASLIVHLFADPAHITEEIISRIIPFVGIALKSRILPFKTAGYIIVCDLCLNATLNEEVLHNILTLCMTKMRSTWFEMAMNTVFVISQNQKLTTLPAKTTVKLLKRCEENDDINLQGFFSTAIAKIDLSDFIVAFSRTMCSYLAESNPNEETKDLILTYLEVLLDLENMTQTTAHGFLDAIMQNFTARDDVVIPERLCPLVKNVVIRFSAVFDQFRAQNHLTESQILGKLMEQCKIAEHEVGVLDFTENKKKRRRRTSSVRILEEDPTLSFGPCSAPKMTKKDQMEALQDGNEIKRMFKKPISGILEMLNKDEIDVKDVEWALQSLNDDNYLSKQTTRDLNDFWVNVVSFISKNPKSELRRSIKVGLVKVNISEKNIVNLLSRRQSGAKKQKLDKSLVEEKFENETDAEFGERILFVLETLLASIVIKPTKSIIRRIFNLIGISQETENIIEPLKNQVQVQQICFAYLVKSLRHSEVLDAIEQECQAEVLINIIRFGHDVNVLRNALKVLTAVAPRMPTKLTSQVMSLFAFMGQGLLKKDNEMTLNIVEESLSSLVSAVLQPLKKGSLELKKQLLAISRIFAKSLHDIPIHRRLKVVKVIGTCVDSEDLWVVFAAIYEDFCLNWVRGTARDWEEELDYLSLDLMGSLPPEHQIQVCIDLLSYIVGLGGDDAKGRSSNQDGLKIFDGSNQPLKKLRHYRYIMIGFVAKSVSQRALFEELSNLTDDEIYERTAKVGIRMLEIISCLDDFVLKELNIAEKTEQDARGKESAPSAIQTLKYWIALSARAEVIADKMRCMLPANVSGHIICDLLDNKSTSSKMRDRALQLLNVKLLSEAGKENEEKTDKFDNYLVKFAKLLSQWIKPAKKTDDVALCQKAAFSLKLLAKRVVSDEVRPTFVEVVKRSSDMLMKWEEQDDSMIGNILLLVAEIVRSGLVSSAVLENCDSISQTCLNILEKCNISNEQSRLAEENSAMAKRVRHRAHSMSGRQFGDDVVFVCALTLVLRLLDHENEGSQSYHEDFLVKVSELSTKYIPVLERLKEGDDEDLKSEAASQKTSSIRHRLQQLNTSFSGMKLEKLQECFNGAVKKVYENTECLATLGLLLEEAIKNNENNDKIGSLSVEFLPVVIDLLEVRKNTKHTEENLEALKLAETAAIRAFISLTENLSESELTPVFGEFADWVEEGFSSNEPNIKYRVSTVYFLANKFYDYYNTLALPYFNRLFSYVPKLMRLVNVAKTTKDELFIDGSSKGSVEGIVAHELIVRLLQFVTKCAKHRVFIGEDRADVVYECILDELENRKVRGHEQRCVNYLIDCIYHISESSPDLFSTSICHKLLEKLRHSNGRIRHRSLVVFDRVANRAGDAMAPLLPVVVQALTEVLEDNDQKVADQCDRTIRMLKGVFGEEILQN